MGIINQLITRGHHLVFTVFCGWKGAFEALRQFNSISTYLAVQFVTRFCSIRIVIIYSN